MSSPTRGQIEATFALPTYKVEIFTPANTWVQLTNAYVSGIDGAIDSTSNLSNPLAFGSPSSPSANVEIEDYAPYLTYKLSNAIWINRPIRIYFGFDTSDFVPVFFGPITRIDKTNEIVRLDLSGIEEYIKQLKLTSAIFYRRPSATKTTIASVEDPTDVSYNGGLINYALWYAGGRPYEQQGINYTEASTGWKFWYSLEQAILSPDFSWLSADNTLDDLYMLARATGGQLYQDADGVYRYTQPLSLADTSGYGGVYYTFTDDDFESFNIQINNNEQVGTIFLQFSQRFIQPEQVVLEDKESKFFLPSETKTVVLEPQEPIYSYSGLVSSNDITATNTMKAIYLNNTVATPQIGPITADAARVSIEITNPSSTLPMIITSIKIEGRPLQVGEDITITYPEGSNNQPNRIIENNPYVQTVAHAQRLARMIFDFYSSQKPIVTLDNVQYDPDRFVGELVKLNCTFLNDGQVYRIVGIRYTNGVNMTVSLVNVTGIPIRGDMFIVGTAYSGSDFRELSY